MQPAPRRIFSFYGKTLRTLDIFPFWMYPYIKQYTVIYPAAFSVCSAGNLSASIISARVADTHTKNGTERVIV